MNGISSFVPRTRIAHFSMEIALAPEMHTYSGGLGILAGDTARSAADLDLPMVFVSLVSRAGFVQQGIDAKGRQVTAHNPWRPEGQLESVGAMISVQIEGRDVWIRSWLHVLKSPLGHGVPVLLLDTNIDQNMPEDQQITDELYGRDQTYRLKQEIILGIGGAAMLKALGFDIRTYHMNEGHAAFLTTYLLRQFPRSAEDLIYGEPLYEHMQVRERCVFTTHTPVEAAFDKFPYSLVERVLGDYIEIEELKLLGGQNLLNITQLALSLSGYVNGVSERHAETSRQMFPGYRVHAITNGVHAPTWTHAAFAKIYGTALPHWAHEPEVLTRADQLPDDAVWGAHQAAKRELLALIHDRTKVVMRDDVPLIGYARRMTEYKRPDLLFTDINRLVEIARQRPFQIVLAGIAHPNDEGGKRLIERLENHAKSLSNSITMAYLPNYNMSMAASLVAGVDIWLNTPLPPLEASGTSGMKGALNGVLNLSVLDGWWIEAHIEGVTGWAIGNGDAHGADADDLYHKLENTILPLYYDNRTRWIWMMKQAISKIGSYFNSQRMMRRYASEAYIR